MSAIGLLWALATPALAAIGDPCDDGVCPAGEACVTSPTHGMYCTTRCPAEGCPEGYECRRSGGLEICLRPEPRAAFGESCADAACDEGLVCVEDPGQGIRFCSRGCAGPGTCVVGYVCVGGERPVCGRREGGQGGGEVCDEGACSEELSCIEHPTRGASFCSAACGGEDQPDCRMGFVCEGGQCVPDGSGLPGFGAPCVAEGAPIGDPSLAGCQVMEDGHALICHQSGAFALCTRICSRANPCPEGFGCVERIGSSATEGLCQPGVPDDDIFADLDVVDPPPDQPPPPPADAGMDPSGRSGSGGGGGGCQTSSAPASLAVWMLIGLWAVLRRRQVFSRL